MGGWNKGISIKEETREKLSKISKERDSIKSIREYYKTHKRMISEETKRKIGEANKISLKGRLPKSAFKKGMVPYNKSKSMSYEQRIKISRSKQKGEFIPFKHNLIKRIRMNKKYLEWRSNVFKRDNYHCQNCGEKGYLEAHHIIPFSSLLSIFNTKNLEEAITNKALWDEGNGISYCRKCHILLDSNIGGKCKMSLK